ncbi:Pseudouridine synthase II [Macleaya cordata]|uniref:tRNA pseudouridine(55) synthase n=1 Tax=Macleaya cordata TaxID=56857 RepID=A0A200RDN2_MACCD|nr:Pseudouridine synthase II [Macleaya cordata]
MAKSLSNVSLLIFFRPKTMAYLRPFSLLPSSSRLNLLKKSFLISSSLSLSTTSTPYPLQYDLIISRPASSSLPSPQRRRSLRPIRANPDDSPESSSGLDGWVDRKMLERETNHQPGSENLEEMDKSKRKYYNKRRKRMYGSDSEDDRPQEDSFVELKQEVVDFPRLHKREEELYFYDAFAYPWEKDKHYKMVYQLEKKYFPDQCLDKAFIEPGETNANLKKSKMGKNGEKKREKVVEEEGDKGLVFFDEEKKDKEEMGLAKDVSEKKVEEFFKCLKKVPNKEAAEIGAAEPYLVTRNTELPPRWDGQHGTVVLVNKPKGWTSFTVCGKLRRLVRVQKVGHAGTLDPMATGLLIVCVGKATKVVDSYQGMTKGYSGVFRLGEATSTWDADSPVIQREPWEHIKDEEIKKIASTFCGEIWQVPPMFSAIKVGGEKMYEKARRGETVELSPRRISIFQFDIERSLNDRQNLIFRVTCSKGTYIRSLCADFGKALGSCAHLTALRRDSIGEYSADDAWDFPELEQAITKGYF